MLRSLPAIFDQIRSFSQNEAAALAPGEPVILLHVGRDPMNGVALASRTLVLTAPFDETHLKPERFTGFE